MLVACPGRCDGKSFFLLGKSHRCELPRMTQVHALLLTLLVEVPLAAALGALYGKRSAKERGRMGTIALAGTLLTHPLAWWTNQLLLAQMPFAARALFIELGVVLVEGLLFSWLAKLGILRGLVMATLTNGASFGVGLVVYYWL